jgi:hypothetical protein
MCEPLPHCSLDRASTSFLRSLLTLMSTPAPNPLAIERHIFL